MNLSLRYSVDDLPSEKAPAVFEVRIALYEDWSAGMGTEYLLWIWLNTLSDAVADALRNSWSVSSRSKPNHSLACRRFRNEAVSFAVMLRISN